MKNRSLLHYVTTGDKGEKMPGSAEFFLFDNRGCFEMIKNGYKAGLSVEILSQISGFPVEKVKEILA